MLTLALKHHFLTAPATPIFRTWRSGPGPVNLKPRNKRPRVSIAKQSVSLITHRPIRNTHSTLLNLGSHLNPSDRTTRLVHVAPSDVLPVASATMAIRFDLFCLSPAYSLAARLSSSEPIPADFNSIGASTVASSMANPVPCPRTGSISRAASPMSTAGLVPKPQCISSAAQTRWRGGCANDTVGAVKEGVEGPGVEMLPEDVDGG